MFVQIEPTLLETTSKIVISCYSSPSKTQKLACSYKWFRSHNNQQQAINNSSEVYQCSPYDLGYKIIVEIKSNSQTKEIEVGIVKMDSLLRPDVCRIIQQGSANFIVNSKIEEIVVSLNSEGAEIVNAKTDKIVNFKYENISFQIANNEAIYIPQSWRSFFDVKTKEKTQLKFSNKTVRDLFLFSYRGLRIKQNIGSYHILHIMDNLELQKQNRCDLLMEIQQLNRELEQYKRINKKFKHQKQQMQKQMDEIKSKLNTNSIQPNSTKIVQQLSQSVVNFQQLDEINKQLNILTTQNTNLKSQYKRHKKKQKQMQDVIEYLQQYKDKVKNEANVKTQSYDDYTPKYKARMQELRIQNDFLFKQKEELMGSLEVLKNNVKVLDLKYKRTLEIIDQYSEKLQNIEEIRQSQKQQIQKLQTINLDPRSSHINDYSYKQKYESLYQKYKQLKRGQDALNRSKDLSYAASLVQQQNYIRQLNSKF